MPDRIAIGEVASRTGLQPSAIRYYEELGLLSPPRRAGGKRRYAREVLDELSLVMLAREAGFTIRETRQLVGRFDPGSGPALKWRALATRKLEELDAQRRRIDRMRRVLRHALSCGCLTLAECAPILRGARRPR